MTLGDIQRFRERFKGLPMIITADNQHIYYDNVSWSCPLLWDDDNETLRCIDFNDDQYHQETRPITVETTEYEHIQFIKALLTTEEALGYLEEIKSILGDNKDDKYEYIKKFIAKNASNHMRHS